MWVVLQVLPSFNFQSNIGLSFVWERGEELHFTANTCQIVFCAKHYSRLLIFVTITSVIMTFSTLLKKPLCFFSFSSNTFPSNVIKVGHTTDFHVLQRLSITATVQLSDCIKKKHQNVMGWRDKKSFPILSCLVLSGLQHVTFYTTAPPLLLYHHFLLFVQAQWRAV